MYFFDLSQLTSLFLFLYFQGSMEELMKKATTAMHMISSKSRFTTKKNLQFPNQTQLNVLIFHYRLTVISQQATVLTIVVKI